MLQIRLLGQFDIRLDGRRILIPSRAGQSLLAYLVLTAGTAHRREKLAGILWPDFVDDTARKNLRHELWRIRKAFSAQQSTPVDYLLTDEFTIAFNREAEYWLDVGRAIPSGEQQTDRGAHGSSCAGHPCHPDGRFQL
jgi:DNA-binding SARP family transcriptional activator